MPANTWAPSRGRASSAGACTHIYGSLFHGIAGDFSRRHLDLVRSCLPGAVEISEPDHDMHHHEERRARRRLLRTTTVPEPQPHSAQALMPQLPAPAPQPESRAMQVQRLPGQAWNLARVSQRNLPLDPSYSWLSGSAAPVTIYVVDR